MVTMPKQIDTYSTYKNENVGEVVVAHKPIPVLVERNRYEISTA